MSKPVNYIIVSLVLRMLKGASMMKRLIEVYDPIQFLKKEISEDVYCSCDCIFL